MKAVIYHNSACGTSRNVLAALRAAGYEVEIIDYLKAPPNRAALEAALKRMGKTVREILRKRGTPYDALGLDDASLSDDALFTAIQSHPILIERPIVVIGQHAALCRPSETVETLIAQARAEGGRA